MANKSYVSVGDLRKLFENLSDDTPVVSAPLNRDIRTNFGIGIDDNGKFGNDYEGKLVVLNVDLFDTQTGRRIFLVPDNGEPDPIRIRYNFNNNQGLYNMPFDDMFRKKITEENKVEESLADENSVEENEQGND